MSTHTNPLPLVRLTMTLRTDADLSQLLSCLEDTCVYEVADAAGVAGVVPIDADTIQCCAELVRETPAPETPAPAPAPTFSAAPPPGSHAMLALQEIVRARDYCRTHGIYPPGTVTDGPHFFDEWAADLAERVLGGEA